jgi:hypothetical protein
MSQIPNTVFEMAFSRKNNGKDLAKYKEFNLITFTVQNLYCLNETWAKIPDPVLYPVFSVV